MTLFAAPMPSMAQVSVGVGVNVAPPAIPAYVQPPAYRPNYLWTPGYWRWSSNRYYWTQGAWVRSPAVGLLWTPGYWGWRSNAYYWHGGYWGRSVGFYGGVNYRYGYYGSGYAGGRWYGSTFRYNTAVSNVNRTVIHNTYVDKTVVRTDDNRVSYNGGRGGIHAEPTASERAADQNHYANHEHSGTMTGHKEAAKGQKPPQ